MKINPIDQTATEEKPISQDADVQRQLAELDTLLAADFTPPESTAVAPGAAANDMPDLETSGMCKMLLNVIFSMMGKRRGSHWDLKEDEAENLSIALAAVLDKYMPEFKGGPEATLILVALLIVGPRAAEDMENRERLKKLKADAVSDKSPAAEKSRDKVKPENQPPAPVSDLWIKDAA